MRLSRLALLALSLLIIGSLAAFAQTAQTAQPATPQQPAQPDMEKMMAEYLKLGAPGPQHEKIATLAGEWTATSKMWMGPDAQAMETPPGTHTGEMILGGRFLKFTEKGDMMGFPMEGLGIMGYDNFKGRYQMIWMDNTSSALYTAAGSADSTGNTITLAGKVDDPMKGEKNKDVRYLYKFKPDGTIVFEMWDTIGEGKFYKSMETTYTKK